jgi:hypothetical protein
VKSPAQTVGYELFALAGVTGMLLVIFGDPASRRAVWFSAGLALVVQAVCFSLARLSAPNKLFRAWGVGALIRMVSLVLYALVLLKPFQLPPTPALLSFATLLFVTTVLESWLLTS